MEYWQLAVARAQLAERNGNLRMVLGSVDQAILSIDNTGALAAERSAAAHRWLGCPPPGGTFAEYVGPIDPAFAEEFTLAHESLAEESLPRDVCIAQLPSRLTHGDAHYHGSYIELQKDHVIRNAVDHGIEGEEERSLTGKASPPTLMLSARTEAGELQVEIADDGRGIDWSGVRDRAAARGLPCSTQDDLVRALFHPGFTKRDTATAVSGRGIGMGAVEHELRRLGGAVSVTSARGRGTTWCFTFPLLASVSRDSRGTSTTERSVTASVAAE